jgi:hypothetical protein
LEIEYQNKNTISWCLEREGPPICLKATIFGKKLQSIEITSEDFSLTFEYDEARSFIEILNQITKDAATAAPEPVVSEPEPLVPEYVEPEPLVPEYVEPEPVVPEYVEPEPVVPEYVEPEPVLSEPEPEPLVPEYVEPEPVVSELEPEPLIPEYVEPEPVVSEPEPEPLVPEYGEPEPVVSEPKPEPLVPEYGEPEPVVSEPKPEPLVPEYGEPEPVVSEPKPEPLIPEYGEPKPVVSEPELIEPKKVDVETASFFRSEEEIEPEVKSPLEQILEENQGVDISTEKDQKPYSPTDFKDETFVSKFDTKSALELIERLKSFPEYEDEPEPALKLEDKQSIDLEPEKKDIPKKEFITEAERKKTIEKERAERRRRLWELTRGF